MPTISRSTSGVQGVEIPLNVRCSKLRRSLAFTMICKYIHRYYNEQHRYNLTILIEIAYVWSKNASKLQIPTLRQTRTQIKVE